MASALSQFLSPVGSAYAATPAFGQGYTPFGSVAGTATQQPVDTAPKGMVQQGQSWNPISQSVANQIGSWQQSQALQKQQQMFGLGQGSGTTTGTGPMTTMGGDWSGVDQWNAQIQAAANQYGVPANLIKSVMKLESGGANLGMNGAGAVGPMQVVASIWGGLGYNLNDPGQNIMAGAAILKQMYDSYSGWATQNGVDPWKAAAISYYAGNPYNLSAADDPAQGGSGISAGGYGDQVWNDYQMLNTGANVTTRPWSTNGAANPAINAVMQYLGSPYVWGGIPGKGDPGGNWDCCLIGPTRIYGPEGTKRIDEVKSGDLVWSWRDGRVVASEVTNAWLSKRQPVFQVRTRGRSVVASANHPFLVMRTKQRGPQAHAVTEWVRLDELKRGDYLVTFEGADTGGHVVDADEAWLFGLMLGDGNLNGKTINLCVYGERRDRAVDILKRMTGNNPTTDEKHGIVVSAPALTDRLRAMGFDRRAHEKRIPEAVWTWDANAQLAFLDGYREADGHIPNKQKYGIASYASASRDLIEDVRAMHLALGHAVGNITTIKRTRPIVIRGREVKDAKPLHTVALYERGSRYSGWANTKAIRDAVAQGDGRWMVRKVRDITPMGDADTYDLEIVGTANFVADGVVVHNSGLTYWVDQNYGNGSLPMGSHYQYDYAQKTGQLFSDTNQLQPGDLVFFNTGWQGGAGSELNGAGHVAMYIGNGKMIHAANPSQGTIVSDFASYAPSNGYQYMGAMHMSFSGGAAGVPGMTGQTQSPSTGPGWWQSFMSHFG